MDITYCRLCLEKIDDSSFINIFGENEPQFEMHKFILKHFDLQVK